MQNSNKYPSLTQLTANEGVTAADVKYIPFAQSDQSIWQGVSIEALGQIIGGSTTGITYSGGPQHQPTPPYGQVLYSVSQGTVDCQNLNAIAGQNVASGGLSQVASDMTLEVADERVAPLYFGAGGRLWGQPGSFTTGTDFLCDDGSYKKPPCPGLDPGASQIASVLGVDENGRFCINVSSQRFKTNIKAVERSDIRDRVCRLRAVEYELRSMPGVKHRGLIAEEAISVFPEYVNKDQFSNPFNVNYSAFIPDLIASIQQQQAELKELREQVRQLTG